MRKPNGFISTFVLSALFFCLPSLALAASHTFVCSEWSLQGSASCSDPTLTFTTDDTQSAANNGATPGSPQYDLGAAGGSTWYMNATVSGMTPAAVAFFCADSLVNCTHVDFVDGANVEVPFSVDGSGVGPIYMIITANDHGSNNSGAISDICIDNDATSCSSGPPTPTPTATSTYHCVTDGSSTDCLVQVVDNPVLDLFLGYVLFFSVIVGIIWFTTIL